MSSSYSSLLPEELAHFSRFSSTWWDERGPFSMLHKINPARLSFIRDRLFVHFKELASNPPRSPLKGVCILDVGCGGGLLTEPLCRMGAAVVGIDGAAQNIDVARAHAKTEGLHIDYHTTPVEDFHPEQKDFDVITALEILEHVRDPFSFLKRCAALLRPKGVILVSTLNRTFRSYILGILAAEHILGWVPKGTHHWDQFIKPEEMAWFLKRNGFEEIFFQGLNFHPLTQQWSLGKERPINYFASGVRG